MSKFKRYLREAINNCLREQAIPNVDVGQEVSSPISPTIANPGWPDGGYGKYPDCQNQWPPGGYGNVGSIFICGSYSEGYILMDGPCDEEGSQRIPGTPIFNRSIHADSYRRSIYNKYEKDCTGEEEDGGGSMSATDTSNAFQPQGDIAPDADLFGASI